MTLWGLALAGCGARPALVAEDSVPDLAALKARTAARTREVVLVDVAPPGGPPRRLAVHELPGPPGSDRVIVLVHGMLTDARAWRFVAGALAEDAEVWAVDLPGCGRSDTPPPTGRDPRRTGEPVPPGSYGYTPEELSRDVLAAMRERLARRDAAGLGPARVTLVGHSLGGHLAVRMLGDPALEAEFGPVRALVDQLVLVAGLDALVPKQDLTVRQIAASPAWRYELAEASGELRRLVEWRTFESVPDGVPALQEEAQFRLGYLADARRREAARATIGRLLPWVEPALVRPDWLEMERAEGFSRLIRARTLVVWGRRDELLPVSMGYKLAAEIPGARLVTMERTMHSPQLERPRELASIVRGFVAGGGR